jgi:hypothetical protein
LSSVWASSGRARALQMLISFLSLNKKKRIELIEIDM